MELWMVFVSGNNFLTFLATLICPSSKYLDDAKYEFCHNYFSNPCLSFLPKDATLWVNITAYLQPDRLPLRSNFGFAKNLLIYFRFCIGFYWSKLETAMPKTDLRS